MALKLLGAAGRFGVRYGQLVKRRIASIEKRQRKKQACLFCKGRVKRLSKGIWLCRKCGKKFAGHAYFLDEEYAGMPIEEEKKQAKTKPLKKEASPENKEKQAKKSAKTKSKKSDKN